MRKRAVSQGSNRSIEIVKKEVDRSREKDKGKAFMEDISNRCKEIEERVRGLIERKKDDKLRIQKVSDSYEKRYNMPKLNSKEKYDPYLRNKINRNNSVEIRSNVPRPQSNRLNNVPSYKMIERNRSM